MENEIKYPNYIMENLRDINYLDEKDTSKDIEIVKTMSKSEVLDEMLSYEGIIGYTGTIKSLIKDIYGINLDFVE